MIKRNAPCPCNSGLKYKKCCGKEGESPRPSAPEIPSGKTAQEQAAHAMRQGRDLLGQGRTNEALEWFRKAALLAPGNAEIFIFLAYIHGVQGRLPAALESYETAIRLNPDYPDAYYSYGVALQNSGRHEEAVNALATAVAKNPANFMAWTNRGVSLARLKRYDEAVESFGKSIALNPGEASAHDNLAKALFDKGAFAEAEKVLRQYLSRNGFNVKICLTLATYYDRVNDYEKAEELAGRVLARDPRNPGGSRIMATILRNRGRDDEALALLEQVSWPVADPDVAKEIHFEMGALYDRKKDIARAMRHFSLANALWAKLSTGVKERYLGFVAGIRRDYARTKTELHGIVAAGKASGAVQPVFQVGFPRSGTTLLANILDAHPGVRALAEQPALSHVVKRLAAKYPQYYDGLLHIPDSELQELRSSYWQEAEGESAAQGPAESRLLLVDEHPYNTVYCNLMARLFPNAKVVINLRHPCDVCLSCFMQSFRDNDGNANFTSLEDTVKLYAEFMGLLLEYEQGLPLSFHRFRYEGLVEDFAKEMKLLADFLEIPYSEAFRNFHRHARDKEIINTASYSQVTQPIYAKAKYRWLGYREYLAPFLPVLRPFIAEFGYDE